MRVQTSTGLDAVPFRGAPAPRPRRALLRAVCAAAAFAGAACGLFEDNSNACGPEPVDFIVTVGNNDIVPDFLAITEGQTVCFRRTGNMEHPIATDDGTTFSVTLTATDSVYVHNFDFPAQFNYRCATHASEGETATIQVQTPF